MKKVSIVVLGILLFASPALAQEGKEVERRSFLYAAPGVFTGWGDLTTLRFGGGVEFVAANGLGFAFDAGYLTDAESFSFGLGSVSPAVMYEFPLRGRVRPYLRSGIGLMAGSGGGALFWNLGGGVNYWFRDRTGLKVEVRDSFHTASLRYGLLEVMVGLVFKF
jgi:hypothetical protein